MLLFPAVVADEVRFLLRSVDESNSDSTYRELCQFVEYGSEISILLLQTCLNEANNNDGDTQKMQLKLDLISAVFKNLLDRPNFCTTLSQALENSLMEEGFLDVLSNTLNLSPAEKIRVGLALSESENMDTRAKGQNICIKHIEELLANPTSVSSNDWIHEILMMLYCSEGLVKHMETFTKLLTSLQLKEDDFRWASPECKDDLCAIDSLRQLDLFFECSNNELEANMVEIEKEMSTSDIIRELGYGCTVNTAHCKEVLCHFLPLSEVTISKLLGTIVSIPIGAEDGQNIDSTFCSALGCSPIGDPFINSWNVDVLVDSIKQLAPETNWVHVIENLDYEGFNIPDEAAFSLLMSIYRKACQDPFPLHAICGLIWKNTEGQLSFLRHAVMASPDVFTFSHCTRKLAHTDSLDLSNVHGNEAWICLDLLEVLCQLAERGHLTSIRLLLKYPISNFPEVLLAGIAEINTLYNLLQYDVFSTVFPSILKDTTKYSIIRHLWVVNPNLILWVFLDEHTDLVRVQEICQELKVQLGEH